MGTDVLLEVTCMTKYLPTLFAIIRLFTAMHYYMFLDIGDYLLAQGAGFPLFHPAALVGTWTATDNVFALNI